MRHNGNRYAAAQDTLGEWSAACSHVIAVSADPVPQQDAVRGGWQALNNAPRIQRVEGAETMYVCCAMPHRSHGEHRTADDRLAMHLQLRQQAHQLIDSECMKAVMYK